MILFPSLKPSGRIYCVWQRNMSFLCVTDLGLHPGPPFPWRPALMVYDLHFIAMHWAQREVVWTSRMTRAQSSKQELSIFQLILQSLHCQKSKAKFDLKFIQAKNINTSTLSISSLPLSQDPSWPGNFYFMLNFILDCQLLSFSLSPYSHLISSFTFTKSLLSWALFTHEYFTCKTEQSTSGMWTMNLKEEGVDSRRV